ncbi:MAG: tetratricopeptide repeat protein [Cyclobacteriaceae bacterium]|jgi:tetratricopeptide (TPR) repeat protein|nr:tetratricopeptide repeat protein [Flammeovirgaceae bacterium]
MKQLFVVLFCFLISTCALAQNPTSKNTFLTSVSESACKCIDSINVYNKSRDTVAEEINSCIDKQVTVYQLGGQMMDLNEILEAAKGKKKSKKKTKSKITINTNKNSDQYKKYYYEIERDLMETCKAIQSKIAAEDKQNHASMSKNKEALALYYMGLDEIKSENFTKAIEYFHQCLKIDSVFSFAWDNLGLSYRKAGDLDNAIRAYKTSILIDSTGTMPRQNLAVAYEYQKNYQAAILAYEELALIDRNNAEVFYGKGRLYAIHLNDYEKGLSNMCVAYNLYIDQKSPYRSDAEQMINYIYGKMKEAGNEKRFLEILKENKIEIN